MSQKISLCKKCSRLRPNGMSIPYWNVKAKYLMFAEAPGQEEIGDSPLVGSAGKFLFKTIKPMGFIRSDFFIINSVQCRPVENGRNGKPTRDEIDNCRFWTDRYLKVIKPKFIIAFGNYSMGYLFEEWSGIKDKCGTVRLFGNGAKVIPCIHPASVGYDPDNMKFFKRGMNRFKKEVSK